jgi:hypothetical protein
MLIKFIIAFCSRKPLWFDDYMRFWMVFQRIPLRIKALFHGYTLEYILSPKI